MPNQGLFSSDSAKALAPSATKSVVTVVVLAWLALVFVLGARHTFVGLPGTPPLSVLIGVLGPILVFLAAYRILAPFRKLVLGSDLRWAAGAQAWRFAGLGFLALYTYGVLPGHFAWPAALGDMAIGITAPWIIVALIRRPGFAASKTFVAWNLFGILDLVVAVGSAAVVPLLVPGVQPTAPMAYLPLVLIPTFLVPGFVILHLAALFQARRLAQQG